MTSFTRYLGILVVSSLLTACNTYEGIYTPTCAAYAGDKIELSKGQFVWHKFTDSIILDEKDGVVDQFPGYPMRGRYRIEGLVVIMESAGGNGPMEMFLHADGENLYLLTVEQQRLWETAGDYGECPLGLDRNAGP